MSTLQIDSLSNIIGTKSAPTADLVDGRCTAWCRLNPVTGVIIEAFNVISVTVQVAGSYIVTFSTPMLTVDYICLIDSQFTDANVSGSFNQSVNRTTTSVTIQHYQGAGLLTPFYIGCAIFGGK